MKKLMTWFKREFEMPWGVRPLWFNLFVAGPAALAFLLFLPVGYLLIPPFRRSLNAVFADQEATYAHLHNSHKLAPPSNRLQNLAKQV